MTNPLLNHVLERENALEIVWWKEEWVGGGAMNSGVRNNTSNIYFATSNCSKANFLSQLICWWEQISQHYHSSLWKKNTYTLWTNYTHTFIAYIHSLYRLSFILSLFKLSLCSYSPAQSCLLMEGFKQPFFVQDISFNSRMKIFL